jgi:hypothetical protein
MRGAADELCDEEDAAEKDLSLDLLIRTQYTATLPR